MRDHTLPLELISLGEVDYTAAWDTQRAIATARADGTGPDTVLLLTHPAVYTAGRRTQPTDLPDDGTPVVEVDRGGRITWHGPGQLVGYPLIKLADPVDVVAYVRLLEELLIAACNDLGLAGTGRITGRSGVWLAAAGGRPERKIAAIGVRVARGVTMHGFALNCDADLAAFDHIVPCGITDAGVTSLTRELGRPVTVEAALPAVMRRVQQAFAGELAVQDRTLTRSSPPLTGADWHLDPVLTGSP